jgi:hypothetical protein
VLRRDKSEVRDAAWRNLLKIMDKRNNRAGGCLHIYTGGMV